MPASTTRIMISGLESSTGYEVQISAINDEGESSWSDSGTSTTNAAILDLTVQFSAATYEAAEGGAATTITVLISPPANREVVVRIKSNPRAGTTTDAGEFEIVGLTGGATLTINRDDTTKSFTVQAQHDDDGVHDQIDLGFFDLPTQVRAGEPSSAVLTVTDDEGGTVTLSAEQPEVGVTILADVADPPGPVTGIRWVWSRSVDGLANWNDIADATSASYTPVAADLGNYLRATATYNDDRGPGQKAWKVTANIVRDVDQQPARPSGLAATAGLERVTLSWEDPGDSSITGYEYYQAAELAKLTASDGAGGDQFGFSVSVGGDTMVVGAYRDDRIVGSAYVFVRPAGEDWSEARQVAKLTATDRFLSDQFGHSVSVDGATVVVGSKGDDDSGSGSGSAYVFVRPSAGWASATETAKLTASDGAVGDEFGTSVSVEGDTVVVGAHLDDDNGSSSGSAYAFADSGWTRIGGSGAGTVAHTVDELDGWIEHTFGIRALNGGGLGPSSRSVTATPPANRAPEFATATTARSVEENTAAGENIGEPVTAADLDSGDTLVYSLSGVDAGFFDIDTVTGQITVSSGTNLDYETKDSYAVTDSVTTICGQPTQAISPMTRGRDRRPWKVTANNREETWTSSRA